MLKPFPSFVASLHVTLRIEPLGRAIDETATFEKLCEGLETGALDAVRSASWKGYCITIDKVPPAAAPVGEKADIDPAVVSTAPLDLTNRTDVARTAAYLELVRQASHASSFRLPRYGAEVEGYNYSSRVTVGGVLDVSALADAIRLALKA